MSVQRCEHYVCRCARAAELAAMYDRTGDGRLLREAIGVHGQQVECRLPIAEQAVHTYLREKYGI
jgi:hypothetical protein